MGDKKEVMLVNGIWKIKQCRFNNVIR